MTDELPDLAEWEAKLDEQDARLQARDESVPGASLLGLIPYLPFIAILVIAFLIT